MMVGEMMVMIGNNLLYGVFTNPYIYMEVTKTTPYIYGGVVTKTLFIGDQTLNETHSMYSNLN